MKIQGVNSEPVIPDDFDNSDGGELRGGLTWNAEGQDSGPYLSTRIHWPGGSSSGVTIGRGYDMGQKNAADVVTDLMAAGVSENDAQKLSSAAGLRGGNAKQFVKQSRELMPELTEVQQRRLFEVVTYPRYEATAQRISSSRSVVELYGELDFSAMPRHHYEVLVDLVYRGDYTAESRKVVQPAFVAQSTPEICDALAVINVANDVPSERAKARNHHLGCD